MNKRHNINGFTLIEMMIAIAIGAILLAIGVPSFSHTINKNRIAATSSNLLSDILFTRNEAIKRNSRVVLVKSGTWKKRTVFVDSNGDGVKNAGEELLLDRRPEGNEATIVTNGGLSSSISYSPSGRTTTALNDGTDFFQISRRTEDKHRIRFSATGRPIIRVQGHDDY